MIRLIIIDFKYLLELKNHYFILIIISCPLCFCFIFILRFIKHFFFKFIVFIIFISFFQFFKFLYSNVDFQTKLSKLRLIFDKYLYLTNHPIPILIDDYKNYQFSFIDNKKIGNFVIVIALVNMSYSIIVIGS